MMRHKLKRWLLALIVFVLVSEAETCYAQQVSDKEKAMFISASYMGNYGFVFDKPEQHEVFTKTSFTEKSVEFDYNFKCTEGCKQTLVIQQSISIEPNEKDADSTYKIEEQTMKDMTGKWLRYKPYASYYPCGKRWEYKQLLSVTNDAPAGFIYHYQKGKYTATLMIVGFVFDDPEQFKDFMEPLVKKTDAVLAELGL